MHADVPWMESLEQTLTQSRYFLDRTSRTFARQGREYELSRYLLAGSPGGGDRIRIGVFATIHGDEPEGALGVRKFVEQLEVDGEPIQGYALYLYPVCNPSGVAQSTRHACGGGDLNREFWRGTQEPEVQFLEEEIRSHGFHGIITLHTDDTSEGVYGYVKGAVLSENLLEPALVAAEPYLARDRRGVIDGWPASNGIIREGFVGMLQSPPGMAQPPFEITFETPQRTPVEHQVSAFAAALRTILVQYRELQALAQGI